MKIVQKIRHNGTCSVGEVFQSIRGFSFIGFSHSMQPNFSGMRRMTIMYYRELQA